MPHLLFTYLITFLDLLFHSNLHHSALDSTYLSKVGNSSPVVIYNESNIPFAAYFPTSDNAMVSQGRSEKCEKG